MAGPLKLKLRSPYTILKKARLRISRRAKVVALEKSVAPGKDYGESLLS